MTAVWFLFAGLAGVTMTVSETLTRPLAGAPDGSSAEWLASRPADELTLIIERGLQAGDLFYAANREVQRRAALAAEAAEQARAAALRRRQWAAVILLLALGAAAYLAAHLLVGL